MNWSRKGALLMLAVVVSWTTLPASACLLGMGQTSQPDCCGAMAQGCDSPEMGASSPCCQFHGKNSAVAVVPQYKVEHAQELSAATYQTDAKLPAAQSSKYGSTVATPPPKFPPGGTFALRI
jgi:hypothetical protein